MNLWIVTVNFGHTEPTELLINSLSGIQNSESIKVVIADNAASDGSTLGLKKISNNTSLDIKIISYKKNLYYWPVAKKVINKLKDLIGSYPDWVIVCNNDITFSDSSFFKKLAEIDVKKYPIIGPNIINPNGDHLNPFMVSSLSKLQKLYWKLYFVSYPLSLILLAVKKCLSPFIIRSKTERISENKEVYAVHGSVILFSNYFFSKGGWLDDNFEMYGEELSVAEIAKKLGMPVTYFPQLELIHHEHRSTRTIDKRILFDKAKKSYKYFHSQNYQ